MRKTERKLIQARRIRRKIVASIFRNYTAETMVSRVDKATSRLILTTGDQYDVQACAFLEVLKNMATP
jgi:hypothetical protein